MMHLEASAADEKDEKAALGESAMHVHYHVISVHDARLI